MIMVCQGPENQTTGSLQWTFISWTGLTGQKCMLGDTWQLPLALGWMKTCWKDGGSRCFFIVVALFACCLFGFVFHYFFVGDVAGVRSRYNGTDKWVGMGHTMWNSERINKEMYIWMTKVYYMTQMRVDGKIKVRGTSFYLLEIRK